MFAGVCAAAPPEPATSGQDIFLRGVLPDGTRLQGRREDGTNVTGTAAACATCHRGSGLGAVEGTVWIPPITGPALFGGGSQEVVVRLDRRFNTAVSVPHPPYTAAEFGKIITDGVRPDGTRLRGLMPRYELNTNNTAALAAYLQTLGRVPAPGIRGGSVHLATVITPEVTPARRDALKATLLAFVAQRNVSQEAGLRKKIPAAERRLRTRRPWVLDFWELTGGPNEWSAQLAAHQAAQPVFALLSGTTATDWRPVANFCEASAVACWFPTLDTVPSATAAERFTLYFNQGVALDAAVIAADFTVHEGRDLLVIHDGSPAGLAAAASLQSTVGSHGHRLQMLDLPHTAVTAVRSALVHQERKDAVVLLGGAGLATMLEALPAPKSRVYLAYGDDPTVANLLPAAWKAQTVAVDRFEQGKLREAGVKRFREWAHSRALDVVDERLQAEAFFAASFLAMTVTDLLNNLQPDYLIERAQDTLSMREAERLQMEVQALMSGGGGRRPVVPLRGDGATQLDLATQNARTGTSIYPRLSLGPGQHYASQGAFLKELGNGKSRWLVPETTGLPSAKPLSPSAAPSPAPIQTSTHSG